jgi:hypothetical protein
MGRVCNTNGEERNEYMILGEIQKERDHWEGQNVGAWIILNWILET